MSQFLIQDTTLEDIGDAVRVKLGSEGVSFPRYVKAWTFPSRTVTKQAYSYSVSNGDFSLTNTIKTNLGIDTNEFDHWLIYWTSSNLSSSYPTYKTGIVLYYRDSSGNSTTVANADCFEKYVSVPGSLYNNKVQIDIDTNYISSSSGFSFDVVLTAIPVKADNSFFLTTSDDSNKWNVPETYGSNDLLPVTKLASIISNINIGSKIKIYERLLLVPAGNTNYSSDSGVDQLTYSDYYKKPTSITAISQILCIVWADRDYLYYTMPAQDNVNNEAPIYCCRIGNNTWEEYTRYSTKFLFKPDSKYLWVNDNNNICPDYAGILIYT